MTIDDYSSDDYVYTSDDICEMLNISKPSLSGFVQRGIVKPNNIRLIRLSGERNRRVFYNRQALEDLEAYLTPPEGWLTTKDIANHYNVSHSLVEQLIKKLEDYEEIRRKCKHEYYYDPIILDKIGTLNRRTYVRLQEPVPNEEWIKSKDFGALFGKSQCSVYSWILSGRIPSDCVIKQKNVLYIHRDAIQYVDGKAFDNFNGTYGTRRDLELEPDADEPITLDDYTLTPSQHKRRLKIFYKQFNQISTAAQAWLASLGLTVADL